ncbi:MAG TPA: hypothetical protein VE401_03255 [Solirubrobacterales bacterium]|jgi:hypothetical protein|nr:hypothetical protein [Solirubrobacterales bacterium]
MELSTREFWALIHGLILGGLFLVAFAGGLAGLYSFRTELVTAEGVRERVRRLTIGFSTMAIVAWLTVVTGTWIVYPWYREDVPTSPRSELLANPDTENWHEFGMEWKEHVAWIAPMLATVAAFIVLYYRTDLLRNRTARLIAITLFVAAFTIAAVAGIFGALITKNASV